MKVVMCPPRYLSTRIPNNVWMKKTKIDVPRAMHQFDRAKRLLEALDVEVLLIDPEPGCQDQTYVANIGIAVNPFIILANYKAPGRDCEVAPAKELFEANGYETIQPPFNFEGEADLKKLNDHTYFGGVGQFSDQKAFDWISDRTGLDIIPVREIDEKLYHLDCSLLIIDEQHALVTKEGIDDASLKLIEKYVDVTITPHKVAITGCTNAVLVPERRILMSGTFNPEVPDYRDAMEWMNKTFDGFGYTCVFLDVDEFDKSGADLSCCVFHLDFEAEGGQ